MKRTVILLVAIAVALAMAGGTSLAKSGGDAKGSATAKPLKIEARSVPTKGLMAPLPVEDGKIKVEESSVQDASSTGSTATQAKWLTGTSSNTHYFNPIHNQIQLLTTEFISYWGPRTGAIPRSASSTGARSP